MRGEEEAPSPLKLSSPLSLPPSGVGPENGVFRGTSRIL